MDMKTHQETDRQFAHRLLASVKQQLWSAHNDYENNNFYTTGEIRSLLEDLAGDLETVTLHIERENNV